MKHFYLIVQSSGGYLRKEDCEYRIHKNCNGTNELQMRFLGKDHTDEPNDGWNTVFMSSN